MSNNFSNNLRMMRGNRKKADFARLLGLSAPVYQRYEEGRTPRADVLSVIAERLSVTVEWMMSAHSQSEASNVKNVYVQQQERSPPAHVCESENRDSKEKEIESLRRDLRDARAVIRQLSATLEALTAKKGC